MATTVTYKGETLTTVRNDTKTLKTGGTWVEGDIGITDETSTAVVAVEDVPDSHGGIEKRITAVDISDTDATASDVAQGKVFYSNTGTRTVGTGVNEDFLHLLDIIENTSQTGTLVDNVITNLATGIGSRNSITGLRMNALKKCPAWNGLAFCRQLQIVVLPALESSGYDMFRDDVKLEKADFGAGLNYVDRWCFENCKVLSDVIIRATSVPKMQAIDVFTSCPTFAESGTGGTLYVPSALIDSYKSATNWSTILGYANNQILPIEGSYYETHYADGSEVTA